MNIKISILRLHYNRNTIVIYMYYIRIIGKNFYQTPSQLLPQNLIFKPFLSSSIGCGCPTHLRRLKRCLKASVRTLAMLATPTALFGAVGRMVFFLSENREPVYAYFLCTRSVRCLLHFQVHNYERYSLLFVRGSSLSVRFLCPACAVAVSLSGVG